MKLLYENGRETKWNREIERGIMKTSCWLFRIQSIFGMLNDWGEMRNKERHY